MKNIIILGGGISGLALLWYLKKAYRDTVSITLLEKTSRVGGWIQSIKKEGFLFEQGPHSFRGGSQGIATLQLVEELGLHNQIITANPSAQQRFLYLDKQLQKVPAHFFSLLFSPLTRKLFLNLLMEWRMPRGVTEDESIHSFFSRRVGKEVVETFLDPLVTGIYAGSIHNLSAKSCFPKLFEWERHYGSLTKGAFINRFSKRNEVVSPFIKKMKREKLFSFKDGMEVLPQTLALLLKDHIFTHHDVSSMQLSSKNAQLELTNGKKMHADLVYSTLPASALASLLRPHNSEISKLLNSISYESIAVVSLGYKQRLLPLQGFGYLIPSKENENILGMVWDSCIFPQQAKWPEETRLTVMIGGLGWITFQH